jgi:hypothetical protein
MSLILLDRYKHQIKLEDTEQEIVNRMKGNKLFLCSKEDILKGWALLSNASLEITKDKEIGYFIRDIEKGVVNF